jgi:hypothetical protein
LQKVLVVACHPDDETLWAGGYLAANPGTHVACCFVDTRDPWRTERFYRACAVFEAVPFVLAGAFDLWGVDTRPAIAFARDYDLIITHNHKGEYGHPAHIAVHHAMRELKKPMKVFGYGLARGFPIDFVRKLKALECYYQDPKILRGMGQKFDLSLETLIDCSS